MNGALWVAKTGLDAQQTRMQVISNNLANANTNGFKRSRAVFEDLMYQNVRQVGGQTSQQTRNVSGINLGTGVRMVATEKLFTQGAIAQTQNQFNVAIQGKGMFQISMPDGSTAYTRDGGFQVNENGQMVNANGYPLEPGITVPADAVNITIGNDGIVSAQQSGQTVPTQIGSITLADFTNPAGLQPKGENLFLESATSGTPSTSTPGISGLGTLIQGALETSNVNVVEELVSMIETQRSYEMNSKAISSADQMLQYLNNNT